MKVSIILFFYSFILISQSFGNPPANAFPLTPAQGNIKILSDQMDCDQSKNVCVAKGNAIAEKLNDSKVKILKADQITAHFAKEGGTGPLKVTRLEAEGNVFFIIDDIIVQGLRGSYSTATEIAEVFDDVKITNGKNQLDGGYAKVNMRTGHYSVKHGGERVSALIFTKDKKENGGRK